MILANFTSNESICSLINTQRASDLRSPFFGNSRSSTDALRLKQQNVCQTAFKRLKAASIRQRIGLESDCHTARGFDWKTNGISVHVQCSGPRISEQSSATCPIRITLFPERISPSPSFQQFLELPQERALFHRGNKPDPHRFSLP